MSVTYIADHIFDGETLRQDVPVTVSDGRIVAFEGCAGAEEIRLHGMLAPGFVDVQVNGGGGYLFNNAPDLETLKVMGAAHAAFGTTGFMPTLVTDDIAVMQQAADAVAVALAQNLPGVLGIHFEGPHLAGARKGIHPENHIRELSEQELIVYARNDLGDKMITLAPETVAPDVIAVLVGLGVKVCLGHSNADYETTQAALAAGATGFTHLFNAMSRLNSRDPGMVGAALLDPDSWCGIILDGHHVHAGTARLAHHAKPKGKMMLVTDAMSLIGTQEESFPFFGELIFRDGDRLANGDGVLAGSHLDMTTAVRNAVTYLGIEYEEALRMASLYPAEFLGQDQTRGRLTVGGAADFILMKDDRTIQGTWIGGKKVFKKI
ncbi:N-acetylglucosamine-6-phosphate deacetylase [Paremcibacter congregatus]|uniref:N-acetylglucosamine-6-phosphate deacetylase n=1 Tax=Paremcibacter congregatus TaxID=2043170 RepID=A0A2G4YR57_9PROT|nr:N-acetylglucosamine-6-phosphate deacetylase [Paremcibacter congregatus]PHZ84805.1 N-acetylglucosamine-6-phosphate deacetylase [Paremcibacter congregatus]QDE26220.1 N-acetylglucosamine-6-phosphate deacetylase [Paremcibacter congregatus]